MRRNIIKERRLTQAKLNEIQQQVKSKKGKHPTHTEPEGTRNQQNNNHTTRTRGHSESNDPPRGGPVTDPAPEPTTEYAEQVSKTRKEILNELGKMQLTPMEDRDYLHKITLNNFTKRHIQIGNRATEEILAELKPDLTTLNQIIYAAARVIESKYTKTNANKTTNGPDKPRWKARIEKEIERMRGEISILDELSKSKPVKSRRSRITKNKYNIKSKDDIPPLKEMLKQKIQVKAQRIRRFEKRTKFFRQNRLFENNEKKFYREMGTKQLIVKDPPTQYNLKKFWESTPGEKGRWLQPRSDMAKEYGETK